MNCMLVFLLVASVVEAQYGISRQQNGRVTPSSGRSGNVAGGFGSFGSVVGAGPVVGGGNRFVQGGSPRFVEEVDDGRGPFVQFESGQVVGQEELGEANLFQGGSNRDGFQAETGQVFVQGGRVTRPFVQNLEVGGRVTQRPTVTLTKVFTRDQYVTRTNQVLQSVQVTLTLPVLQTVTGIVTVEVNQPVESVVSLVTSVVLRPTTVSVTAVKTDYRVVTEQHVDHITLTHTFTTFVHTTITDPTTLIVPVTAVVVQTQVSTQLIQTTSTVTITSTSVVNLPYYS